MIGVTMLIGESATRYAASTVCGSTPRRRNSGMKIGASRAHLAIACGMMMPTTSVTAMPPSSSHRSPMLDLLDQVAQLDRRDLRDVASS